MANPAADLYCSHDVLNLMSVDHVVYVIEVSTGLVESPVLGKMEAAAFYCKLGEASEQNVLTVHRIMSSEDGRAFAAHFTYDWTLTGGDNVVFDGVDLFEFNDDDLLVSMKIFYDTHPTRVQVGNEYERSS